MAAIVRMPARRWLLALGWVGVGFVLALGVQWPLPGGAQLPCPFLLLSTLPLVRRFWWPRRMLFLAALGAAMLVGGGAARLLARWPSRALPFLAALVLLGEAFVVLPQLPLPVTDARPSTRAVILARGSGPLLVLPSPAGHLRRDTTALIDQVHHGRPLADWVMHPDDGNVPPAWRKMVHSTALWPLFACEREGGGGTEQDAEGLVSLRDIGITEVYVDTEAVGDDPERAARYLACIEGNLGPPQRTEGPFQVYSPDLPSTP